MSSFGDEILVELPSLRADAESRMRDWFELRRPTGDGWQYDPVNQKDVKAFEVLGRVKGRVKSARTYGTLNQDVGGRTATTVTRELHIPWDSPAVLVDDYAVLVERHPTTDPTLDVGDGLRITGPAPGSQSTARRLEITEVVA